MAFTALSLALITLVSLGSCDSFDSFTSSLESLMCNSGLSVGGSKCSNQTYGLQDFVYSFSAYFDDETTNASIQAQSIIGRLNTAIELRGTMLRNISDNVQTLCNQYHSSGDTSMGIFDNLYFSGNPDLSARLPNDIEYNEAYGNDVSLTTTTFKIPSNVDSNDEIVQFDATISSLLTNAMIDIHEQHCVTDGDVNTYCSMYFGMTSGVFRQFPAKENSRDDSGDYKSYDPRYRPWYVKAASGSKDMVILLDISGSMSINNRLSIAKSAVISVLNTLTSDSLVNIVAFSSGITMSCFEDNFVRATDKNVQLLLDFVNGLHAGGGTDFVAGFEKVFDLFDEKQSRYGANCHSSILFLTDGISEDPTSIINQRNTDINAVIFSYTLGDGADTTIPEQVAELTNGVYTHIADGDLNLVSIMSSYYLYYAHKDPASEPELIFTAPYLDFDTSVVMITMALPVYINDTYFVGVVGADIPLDIFSQAVGDVTIGRKSYSFLMNEESELLLHPLIGNAAADKYTPTYVMDVEPEEYVSSGILSAMIARESGTEKIEATVKQSAGNVEYEGYIAISANLLYIYGGIGPKSLSIALVIYTDSDTVAPLVSPFGLINSPSTLCGENFVSTNISNLTECIAPFNLFHAIDLMLECDSSWVDDAGIVSDHDYAFFANMSISTQYPGYYLQSGLWEDIYLALNVAPTCDSLEELHEFTNRIGISSFNNLPFGGFRSEISDVVLPSIYMMTSVHEFWKENFLASEPANASFVALYFANYVGLIVSYPAHSYSTGYNPLIRPWYQRSVSHPDLFTFTTPYKDATTNKLVITGSTVIYAPNSTYPFGVAGFDFQYEQFIALWNDIVTVDCDYCFLIDSSAFVVYYEGMEGDVDEDEIGLMFFGALEPTLFQSLLDNKIFMMNQTINYQTDTTDTTYTVGEEDRLIGEAFEDNNGLYSIKRVNQTNLLFVSIDGYFRTSPYPSNCPYDSNCEDVYPPGCVADDSDADTCASAQIDACAAFEEGDVVQIPAAQTCTAARNNEKNQCLTSICPTHTDGCYDEEDSDDDDDDQAQRNMLNAHWLLVASLFLLF
eukprot:938905_1